MKEKRLVSKKNNDKEIQIFIMEEAKGHIDAFTNEFAAHIKMLMKRSGLELEDLLGSYYENEREAIIVNTLKNSQGIYDATVDKFYSDTIEDAIKNDPTKYDSPAKYAIDKLIENLEDDGFNLKDLLTEKLIEQLK